MSEAVRYLKNAKDLLKNSPIEDDLYLDVKYVKQACGTAYHAILRAIDEYLIAKGVPKSKLPKSIDAYRKAIQKYLSIRNGKLQREFEFLYDELYIAGYYRGLLHDVNVLKEVFKRTSSFIEKIK